MQAGGFQRVSCNYWNITCNEMDVEEIDIGSYQGRPADAEYPEYLEEAEDDCDLYFMTKEITEDINGKRLFLDMWKNRAEKADEEAKEIMDGANHTLGRIQTVEHQYTFAGTYPNVHITTPLLGSPRHMATKDTEMMTALRNLHDSMGDTQSAWSYAEASLDELRDLDDGIEGFCVGGRCMFPEQKDHYGELLATREQDVELYTGRMREFIEEAEDAIDDYYDAAGALNCSGRLRMPLEQAMTLEDGIMLIGDERAPPGFVAVGRMQVRPSARGFLLNDSGVMARGNMSLHYANGTLTLGRGRLGVPPSDVARRYGVKEMEMIDEGTLAYQIRYRRQGKLLGIIPMEIEGKARVSAEDGSLISDERPLWSFLVLED
jgi:hypothetical protein